MRLPLRKPKAMRPGQTVGLIAPSYALPRPELYPIAVQALESCGYRIKEGQSCLARYGYFAGDDALRADDINAMFRDDSVDVILCVRGGYGATRILDRLDYDAIRANPKVFSGYSDITALHSALREKAGIVTFHGLMAVSDMSDEENDAFSLDGFWRVVSNPHPVGPLINPPEYPRFALAPGRAKGPLIGGNLSLVVACLGTPFAYDFDGAVLFLEDIGERTYSLDRMLTHLRQAGVFERVAGIVLGEFTACDPQRPPHDFTAEEVFADILGGLRVPVLGGVRCGHVKPKLSLPFGIQCEVDADAGTLSLLEGAVV